MAWCKSPEYRLAEKHPAREFVHDNHFPVLDDIIAVQLEERFGLEALLEEMDKAQIFGSIDILDARHFFHFIDAGLGDVNRFHFFVRHIVDFRFEFFRHLGKVL